MNLLRNALIGGIVLVSFLLIIRWNEFQERKFEETQLQQSSANTSEQVAPSIPSEQPQAPNGEEVPDAPVSDTKDAVEFSANTDSNRQIHVSTDTLDLVIDTNGGDIVRLSLPQYYAKLHEKDNPFVLLNNNDTSTYIAQSGLVGPNGTDGKNGRPRFSAAASDYTLEQGKDTLVVDLKYQQENAIITKRFTFHRDSYLIDLEYLIENTGDTNWVGNLYGQIKRDDHNPAQAVGVGMQPFLGAAITTPETNYKKLKFDELAKEKVEVANTGGWVAMVQHYFMSAWVPDQDKDQKYVLRKSRNANVYFLSFTTLTSTTIAPGTTGSIKAQYYAGPKHIRVLEKIAPHLDLTIDYSWLWFIAKPLFYALDFIHGLVGNWGLAIILLTCCIKLVFFYPSAMSYRSMAKMRKVQPLMNELKERYGDDRQRMSAELMKLYKKEKVNPLGGCLPILLQMPVFIALYWMIMESVELRHAPFYLWIHDLSVRDPYFVLPLIMGVTMWIQQKLNPTPADPMQAKVMQLMPFFFTALFMMFPAGLVLYWVVNNTLSITQQYIITRQIEKAD
ncbi:membrane protein insertase YidC [Teredinibacter turnerae]|uniref:membrane protein insertase YidC n=1 Tax=Teredinibacter turnerae TaxID=2426 RepID=UPI0005F79062|nr:membrane protein insertase YidC [Teredinibacter turnerae]